jgi:serine/threonine-protein kinase
MAIAGADRDLLFGMLALQNGLINQVQLVAAFHAWTLDKTRALADHLIALGHLNGAQKAIVEAMAELHVAKHGDVERSLAAISAGRSTRESLARLGDPDIERTLAHIQPRSTQQEGEADADRTATYAVGSATSNGLRFRVLRPHARGGLGAVFVALDQELHREVALKQILDSHADDPGCRQRFLREAEVTGGLEHPGIVPVYGLGSYGYGRPYYAMRFIRGDSLKEAIDRSHRDETLKKDPGQRSLELRKLLRRFTDVCNAIEYAHSRGVLHRDIKPGNIIVGRHGETLVVDWGLARAQGTDTEPSDEPLLRPSSAGGSSETLPGSALGTPAYMSPEQARGDLDSLGPRSDVYSLGGTLYYLLTGKPPQEADDVGEVLRKVQRGEFTRPTQIDPSIDKALEAVCLRAMALQPEDRYASCRALAEDVERWMADEPVTAWKEPVSRRLLRSLTRHRVGVTAAGAALVVALAGTAAVLVVQTRANAALARANGALGVANAWVTRANTDLQEANAREKERFALAQESIRVFHRGVSSDILLKQGEFKALRTTLLRGAREFYSKLEGLLQGQLDRDSRLALGLAYLEVGELTRQIDSTEEAQGVFRRAVALLEDLSRKDPADPEPRHALALVLRSLAATLEAVERHNEALAAYGRSNGILQALVEADPANRQLRGEWAGTLKFYGMSSLSNARPPDEAVKAVEQARSILEAAVEADPRSEDLRPALADVYGALALALQANDRPEEALLAFKRSADLAEALFRANPQEPNIGHELARTYGNLGNHLAVTGQIPEALVNFDRARNVLKAVTGANPTIVRLSGMSAWIDTSSALVLKDLGRNDEALEALERARAAREILIKANPAVTRNRKELERVNHVIADIHGGAGRTSEVLATFERAREFAAGLVDAHPREQEYWDELAAICIALGDRYSEAGKATEALSSFDKALSIQRPLVEADPSKPSYRSNLARTLRCRGVALQRCGRPAEAVSDLRRSIGILRGLGGPTPVDYFDLARTQSLLSGLASTSGSGLTATDGQAAADEAMSSLRQAAGARWRNATWMAAEPDLAPIRSRPDYQALLLDMAFPADPFTRP